MYIIELLNKIAGIYISSIGLSYCLENCLASQVMDNILMVLFVIVFTSLYILFLRAFEPSINSIINNPNIFFQLYFFVIFSNFYKVSWHFPFPQNFPQPILITCIVFSTQPACKTYISTWAIRYISFGLLAILFGVTQALFKLFSLKSDLTSGVI